jgi:PIN domain nuclease of toxin-antitoxin system
VNDLYWPYGHIVEVAGSFDEAFPGDPADRIIAATAIALGLKLVTADAQLRRAPRVQAVW